MTREELEATHPDYDNFIDEWQFYIRSYFGGSIYRRGNYLLQHPFESSTNYARRLKTSYYYNYCGPIVDIFVSHLFRKSPVKDFGSFANTPLFEAFLRDADMEGNTLGHFMREAQRLAGIYGRVSVMVDKPNVSMATRAEQLDNDIRPYLVLITPENLLDWRYGRMPSGRGVLEMVKVREAGNRFRVWSRSGWELWGLDPEGGDVTLIDAGEHGLGVIPLVNLYNKQSGIRMIGVSDIQDIADINKNIYYLCSDAKEIIENTAFPMLAVPYERGDSVQDRDVGPRSILQFDPAEPNSRPYWLEPPHSSLTEIREWVKQDIAEIFRIARMGGVKSADDFSQPRSGVAIELEYNQLYAALSEKADNIELAESRLLELWARWEGGSFDGHIDYPDEFSVRDVEKDLESAIKARGAAIDSATFNRELQKKIVSAVLPKLDGETRARINGEIEAGGTP